MLLSTKNYMCLKDNNLGYYGCSKTILVSNIVVNGVETQHDTKLRSAAMNNDTISATVNYQMLVTVASHSREHFSRGIHTVCVATKKRGSVSLSWLNKQQIIFISQLWRTKLIVALDKEGSIFPKQVR